MNKSKSITLQEYELPITISEEKDGGFVAKCSVWEDCYAHGETIEDAINEISYVASTLIELYKEEGMEIPLKVKSSEQKDKKGFTLTFPLIVSNN